VDVKKEDLGNDGLFVRVLDSNSMSKDVLIGSGHASLTPVGAAVDTAHHEYKLTAAAVEGEQCPRIRYDSSTSSSVRAL